MPNESPTVYGSTSTWPDAESLRIALIGYGEVGGIFAGALAKRGAVSAYDILIADESWAATAAARAARNGVRLAHTCEDAIANAHLVICAVTAARAIEAAEQIAANCPARALVLDVNSASPRTKRACAGVVQSSGGCYVEAAVMSAVPPHGIKVPMLLGGPHAESAQQLLSTLGFAARVGSPDYGVVSAVKLCRSVVIKGMEALAIESLLAARHYGIEREVLASLVETFQGFDWQKQAAWSWRRVVQHGRRRAEEMHEAAATVRDAGIAPRMASATADVQGWVASFQADGVFDGLSANADWQDLADAIRTGIAATKASSA